MSSPDWTWTPPTRRDIADASCHYRLSLSPDMVAVSAEAAAGLAGMYESVGQWWQDAAHHEPPIVHWAPGRDQWNATQYVVDVPPTGTGPLSGITLAVKDSIRIAGVPIAYGSRLIEGHMARTEATVVARARAAGAAISRTGKADDLGLAITGDQNYTGPVLNPWNPCHTTWGSSAGVAALIAAGEVDAGIMADQAGSGRVPSAGTGLAALMPSRGLIPMTGAIGFTAVQDRIVAAARDVETVARLASAMSGSDGRDFKSGPQWAPQDWVTGLAPDVQGLRVGIIAESLDPELTDPAVADAVRTQAALLITRGAQVVEVSAPRYAAASALALVITVQGGIPALFGSGAGSDTSVMAGDPLLAHRFAALFADHPDWLARTVQVSAGSAGYDGGQEPGVWLAAAMDLIPHLAEEYTRHFVGDAAVDVLLTPTAPSVAPTVPGPDMTELGVILRAIGPGITHSCALNLTGLPAGQAPAGLVDGLPVGVQVVAPMLREDLILRVMSALEPSGGWPMAPDEALAAAAPAGWVYGR